MSYNEGTNYQAQREDDGKPMFSDSTLKTIERFKLLNKKEVENRLNGNTSLDAKMEIFKQDFESYRQSKISWGKLQETVEGLLQIKVI